MDYNQLFPFSRGEQYDMAIDYFKAIGFAALRPMTFFAAGMGSGKSNVIAALQSVFVNDITYVLSPNDRIGEQLKKVFNNHLKWGMMVIIDGMDSYSLNKIRAAKASGKPAVVFFSCLQKTNASMMNPSTRRFIEHLNEFRAGQQLVLIDELDLHLTQLTGGINSKVSHHKEIILGPHRALVECQADSSLNVFDSIRAVGAKCIGFSGTFNNTISSKLASMGYQAHEISIVNVAPIESLYWDAIRNPRTTIIHEHVTKKVDGKSVPNDSVLFGFFERVHASSGKGLIDNSTQEQINQVRLLYKERYGKEINCACITATSKPDDDAIKKAQFIIGMKLVGTGLDLSTLAEGCQFSHGILLSHLSDKESNPLSKNLDHFLHMEVSSSFLQLVARLREGGTFVVPKAFDAVTSLGAALQKIFEINRDGRHEMLLVGSIRADQLGRYYQGILLAIVQNLRNGLEERPVVESILTELSEFDSRSIKAEYNAYKGGAAFEHAYWINTIELLWSVYFERFTKGIDKKTFESNKKQMIAAAKARGPRIVQRGNGLRDGHAHDERVAELVRTRAQGICCHCSDPILPGESQMCHVVRKEKQGPFVNGPFTKDNIMEGHIDCDSAFDQNRIICAPGGTYRDKKRHSYEPDMKQWSGISAENIERRWNWSITKMGYSDPDEFKAGLIASGYTFFPA